MLSKLTCTAFTAGLAVSGLLLQGNISTSLAQEPSAPTATTPAPEARDAGATAAGPVEKITLLYARQIREDRLPPLSLLDLAPPDDGEAGAKLAIADNNTTGKFTGQEFALDIVSAKTSAELVAEVVKKVDGGVGFVVADADAPTLLALSDALKDKSAVIFNTSAPDDSLREESCRVNIKHTIPTRSMFADAIGQFLAWKRWLNWAMVIGPSEQDKRFAEAVRRSAKRFGSKIVEERSFTYEPGNRRTDGGYEQVQQQIPQFTQKLPPHDVVFIADEGELFGDYFPYRTWDARPVVGTSGLFAATWHPAIEQWGGSQFQNRFKRLANRPMRQLDYNVWMAVRSVGEAATRKKSGKAAELIEYMRSPEFELAAFKGQKLSYRPWNGQLRQPILVATAKLPVTVSPQVGFLHQFTELDTLGVDKPETKCTAFPK